MLCRYYVCVAEVWERGKERERGAGALGRERSKAYRGAEEGRRNFPRDPSAGRPLAARAPR